MVCISWYIAYCPLYSRCPLFGVSAKSGSTVVLVPPPHVLVHGPNSPYLHSHGTVKRIHAPYLLDTLV